MPKDCSICFEILLRPDFPVSSTPCGHVYHTSCLHNWIERNENRPTCPICRNSFQLSSVIPLLNLDEEIRPETSRSSVENNENLEKSVDEMRKILRVVVESIDGINISIVEMKSVMRNDDNNQPKSADSPSVSVSSRIFDTTIGNVSISTLAQNIPNFLQQFGLSVFGGRSFGSKLPQEEICGSKVCLQDASRLLKSITTDKMVKPCNDFKEFALGSFIRNQTQQERSGFIFDNLKLHRERQKKLLQMPIIESDNRVFKIAKNFYQKCVDTEYIKTHGKSEVEDFCKNKTFPLIDGADWWPNRVNLTANVFDPSWKLDFFLAYTMSRCRNPRDPEGEIICFKFNHEMDFIHKTMIENPDKTKMDFLRRLNEINSMIRVDEALVNASVNHLMSYLEKKLNLIPPEKKLTPMVLKIRIINKILLPNSTLSLNWFKIINDGYLEHSKPILEEEEIMIEHWELFSKTLDLLENTQIRILMDIFHLGFLYDFEHTYVPYPINKAYTQNSKSIQNFERQEQCLYYLETNFSPVLVSLYEKVYMKDDKFEDVEEFAREAVNDVITEMKADKKLDKTILDDVVRKLKKVVILPGGRKEIFDDSKLEEIYEELELKGDEHILETSIKLKKYAEKLDGESKRGWFYRAYKLSKFNNIQYFPVSDLLLIPIDYLEYPYYDKNRSRFYNTATLFTEVIRSINDGLRKHMKSEYRFEYKFNYDSIQLGYKNYAKWERENKIKERKLPGFTLSNQQMYWLTFANSYFMKNNMNHRSYQFDALNLQYKYFHIWFKAREEFREAFNCDGMTEKENQEFEALKEQYEKVRRF